MIRARARVEMRDVSNALLVLLIIGYYVLFVVFVDFVVVDLDLWSRWSCSEREPIDTQLRVL